MKVALLDREGTTAEVLAAAGMKFTRLETLEDFVPLDPYKLIILGEQGLDMGRLERMLPGN